jgi:hypothetical protein
MLGNVFGKLRSINAKCSVKFCKLWPSQAKVLDFFTNVWYILEKNYAKFLLNLRHIFQRLTDSSQKSNQKLFKISRFSWNWKFLQKKVEKILVFFLKKKEKKEEKKKKKK